MSTITSVTSTFAYDVRSNINVPNGVTLCKTAKEVFDAAVVFFCVPISKFEAVLQSCVPFMRSGQLIADTCSVKAYPAEQMQKWVPRECPLLATHPLFGPDSIHNDDKRLVIYPLRDAKEHSIQWEKNFLELGIQTITMDPDTHDYQIANTQAITHLIARALIREKQQESYISSLGYKLIMQIMTQTCNDTVELFTDMHCYNPYTKKARNEFQKSLDSVIQLIERSEWHEE